MLVFVRIPEREAKCLLHEKNWQFYKFNSEEKLKLLQKGRQLKKMEASHRWAEAHDIGRWLKGA